MKKLIIPAVVVLAALGVWQKDAIQEKWETRDMTEDEKEQWHLHQEGVIHEDGTFHVDDEFDHDLEVMDRDLHHTEASASHELDHLEKED